MNAVKSVQSNLTAELSACCNVTLDAISAAVVAVEPTEGPTATPISGDDDLPDWAIALIVFAVLIVVGVVAVILVWAVSR